MIGEGEKLIDCLGGGVTPAAADGGSGERVVIFVEGECHSLAIDLRRGGDHYAPAIAAGCLQDRFRTADVDLDGIDWPFDDIADADGRRQVKDDVAFADESIDDMYVADVLNRIAELGVSREVFDICQPAGGKVIDDGDLVAALQQPLRQMTADKAGAPSDQCAHHALSFSESGTNAPSGLYTLNRMDTWSIQIDS